MEDQGMRCSRYSMLMLNIVFLFIYLLFFRVSTAQLHNPPPYQSRHQSLQSRFTDDNSRFTDDNSCYTTDKKQSQSSESSLSDASSSFDSDETDSMVSRSIGKSESFSESEKSDYSTDGDNAESAFV